MLVNAPVSYLYIPDIARIEFQKKQSVFSLTVLMPDTRSFLTSDMADLPTNLKIKHVLQSLYYSTTVFSPGGVLPYITYIGMCRCEGYGFQAV